MRTAGGKPLHTGGVYAIIANQHFKPQMNRSRWAHNKTSNTCGVDAMCSAIRRVARKCLDLEGGSGHGSEQKAPTHTITKMENSDAQTYDKMREERCRLRFW
jgi:hypothetical protein